MGKALQASGRLKLEGAPPYEIPEVIDEEFMRALLSAVPGEEEFIAEVLRYVSHEDKERVIAASKAIGGDIYRIFCIEASKWAPVVNPDNVWHLNEFKPIYQAEVKAGWVDTIIITSARIRFVTAPKGTMTFAEFKHFYGIDIGQHLDNIQRDNANRLSEIKRHISSDIVKKEITVVNSKGEVERLELTGLESINPESWALPVGCQFISAADD